jgi:N-acetylneuraminate synthase/N,N'-diacetyllegionaminate synthase
VVKTNKIKIGNKYIGESEPCFIIAEAGVNHNGELGLAKKLIDVAVYAGVDAVKFQTFKAEDVIIKQATKADYQLDINRKKESQQKMLKRLELKHQDFLELKKYCDKKDIIFLSTPHSEDAIDLLEPLVPLYKVSSSDLTNIPFLEKIAKKGKPIILSTGMATMEEVKESLNVIYMQGNREVVLLHCTTNYPCPLDEVNLNAMQNIRKELNCLVGYSDHTLGINVSIAAVVLGATLIEKHFTLDKNLPGPDHKASLEPNELNKLVHDVRNFEDRLRKGEKMENILKTIPNIEEILGDPVKRPTKSEEKMKKLIRKSIIAKINIPKGTIISKDMLVVKRPGTGIAPKYINDIVGKEVKKDIKQDELIFFDMLI